MNWTPVDEALPEEGSNVLVAIRETRSGRATFCWLTMAMFYRGMFRKSPTDHGSIGTVTHWMPLPEFPESYGLSSQETSPDPVASGTPASLPSPP